MSGPSSDSNSPISRMPSRPIGKLAYHGPVAQSSARIFPTRIICQLLTHVRNPPVILQQYGQDEPMRIYNQCHGRTSNHHIQIALWYDSSPSYNSAEYAVHSPGEKMLRYSVKQDESSFEVRRFVLGQPLVADGNRTLEARMSFLPRTLHDTQQRMFALDKWTTGRRRRDSFEQFDFGQ